ncbi:hypothetical protein [Lacticaseibacillus zhaodongensis]|uniref:hypothetical protein n=1 Tax=Lacticaseibacillus zhaodongensis TaxID=2668065 RepID=UPI0012D37185|nr:hypothetical protein [Lacticaseibacillus zhaodongensis]
MSYTTIKSFTDKNPNSAEAPGAPKHIYWKGDRYPTKGGYIGATTKARLDELISGGWIERDDD